MTFSKSILALSISAVFLLSACSEDKVSQKNPANEEIAKTTSSAISSSEAANKLFDEIFMEGVYRNPVRQTFLGIKKDYDKWNDLSLENTDREHKHTIENLARIKAIDVSTLDEQTKLSYQLYTQLLQNRIDDYKYRYNSYPVNQMYGTHSRIPAFLINQHSVDNIDEAKDYISRLNGVKLLLSQLIDQLKIREEKGVIAPKFVFEHVIRDSGNILKGAPFTEGNDSTLLADFSKKVNALNITDEEKAALITQAIEALISSVKPGYDNLISYLTLLEKKATDVDGVWRFSDGEAFYNNALKRTTTTDLTADEIHKLGLSEVARIHDEMREIMTKVGFEGDLQAFFKFMRHDKQFYYADNEEGRTKYLTEATDYINVMKGELDKLFITKPKADLTVKKVEAFREKSAGKAFYQQPAPDGSRPGTYYANLYKMEAMPTYQMEALAYHEGIPGHHMQIALQQELEGIPKFRKFGRYTAYSEGWGLYSEMIPKEIGFYKDPYSDFGRLAMELWRACRLVVDTGIHKMKWTREQGIAYYVDNTPNAESDAIKMVERHVVMPSQATAYKIGMIKIIELREMAKSKLGDKFDIREFHDVVLTSGPLPLNVVEDKVNKYIASKA